MSKPTDGSEHEKISLIKLNLLNNNDGNNSGSIEINGSKVNSSGSGSESNNRVTPASLVTMRTLLLPPY